MAADPSGYHRDMETLVLILALIAILLSILAIGQSLLRGRAQEETEDVEALLSDQASLQEKALRDEFERARESSEKSDARLREEMSK